MVIGTGVNHSKYARVIGRKRGEVAGKAVERHVQSTLTREEVLTRLREIKEGSGDYTSVVKDMDSRQKDLFWDGLEEGFYKEIPME